jgi:hypothetical protein
MYGIPMLKIDVCLARRPGRQDEPVGRVPTVMGTQAGSALIPSSSSSTTFGRTRSGTNDTDCDNGNAFVSTEAWFRMTDKENKTKEPKKFRSTYKKKILLPRNLSKIKSY